MNAGIAEARIRRFDRGNQRWRRAARSPHIHDRGVRALLANTATGAERNHAHYRRITVECGIHIAGELARELRTTTPQAAAIRSSRMAGPDASCALAHARRAGLRSPAVHSARDLRYMNVRARRTCTKSMNARSFRAGR